MLDFTTERENYVNIFQGNCLDILKTLEDKKYYTCVTSPPYYNLRDYNVDGQIGLEQSPKEYIDKLVEVFMEVHRVLKDDGTLWINIGDSYAANRSYQVTPTKHKNLDFGKSNASKVPDGLKPKDLIGIPWRLAFALQDAGWYLRSDIIWEKPNQMPESVKDRCTKSHEYLFMLTKSEKYYFDQESIMEDSLTNSPSKHWKDREYDQSFLADKQANGVKGRPSGVAGYTAPGKRNKRSVWSVPTKPFSGAHFATMPEKLVEPCILAGCPKGEFVIDPFGGAGTTGLVAKNLWRKADLIELNPEYVDIAKRRLA